MADSMTETQVNHADLRVLFDSQRRYAHIVRKTSATERIKLLNRLEKALLTWRERLQLALHQDFGKPPQEVDLVDIYWVLREIRYARANLRTWMRPTRVPVPLAFMGATSHIVYEPKGASLIISPWNYPVNLSLGPLVGAIAAGCTAIIKPSEYVPHVNAVVKELLNTIFPEEHVAVVEGGVPVSQALLKLPFHHLFFTGSTEVGKIVMKAAADAMASVTLELGGKSPVIVDRSADLIVAARRIVQTKFVNAGQTCVAPDYILAHAHVHDKLIGELQHTIKAFYPDAESLQRHYCDIIHDRHHVKMQSHLDDAVSKNARILTTGNGSDVPGKMPPTLLTDVPMHATVMQEEIFGPILPVIRYAHTQEAIDLVNNMDRPLGLYVFGRGNAVREIIENTHAGGTCINHCALNYYNSNLPFGGVNTSGFGKSHGYDSFLAFSNKRGIYKQRWKYAPLDWLHPPYTSAKQKLIDFTLRWL